jgi:dienelactone hydrolase
MLISRGLLVLIAYGLVGTLAAPASAQAYGQPDRASPGDEMIQRYLARETARVESRYADDLVSRPAWEARRPQLVEEYYYMLGLSPRPDKTPLNPTITGTFQGEGYLVDMIHYQSRPGLYVTGNLYRPASVKPGEKLPAIFYVCGHSNRGRDGNKTAYQSHGIWFARHGYICLVVDSLQMGEIAAIHHGTYRYQRWWWLSRGYTSAGVEAWNGIRGIDYLAQRPDVDPGRIAVTGISGGGAATFWIAAADERVRVAVPVSGMADLESYITNRVINGHCDCMFLHNTFQWPWTRIANLIAPRPMLFVNSDKDPIFPMDANDRVSNRLERFYSHFGASDVFDTMVSIGGHAYRQDIRQAAYRFINTHLKDDPRQVTDSELDIVSEGGKPGRPPIPAEKLRVFPTDADIPKDQLNTRIDELFVPMARPAAPQPGQHDQWKANLLAQLQRVTFTSFPERVPAARKLRDIDPDTEQLGSEQEIEFRLRYLAPAGGGAATGVLLVVLNEDQAGTTPDWIKDVVAPGQAVVLCEPRGIGSTRWTTKNPPNYVERSLVLLGRTADSGRVWDAISAARYLHASPRWGGNTPPIHIAGQGQAGIIAAYAAVLDEQIAAVTIISPPATHMAADAPALLNVLRICDIPDALGLLAPRPLTIISAPADNFARTTTIYQAAGAQQRLSIR